MKGKIEHSERSHALLSPSAGGRWIRCTNSVPLSLNYPDTSSQFADEGTRAHELAEYETRKLLGMSLPTEVPPADDEDMQQHALDYAMYIKEQITNEGDYVDLERKVYLNEIYKDESLRSMCYGTADCLVIGKDRTLHIIDYKYGQGVEVSAVRNYQLMLYAAMTMTSLNNEVARKIRKVKLHIYQPRIGNISVWELTLRELNVWYLEVVRPAIISILEKNYYTQAGDHCRWCKHRPKCYMYAMTYVDQIEEDLRLERWSISRERIAEILKVKDDVVKWLNELSDTVTNEILSGEVYDGFKVVEGRSIRKITDEEGAVTYLRSEGYKEQDIFKPLELNNITTLQKLMGKKAFDEQLSRFITKPKGKPTLVTSDDKRPDYVQEDQELALFKE